MLKNFLESRLEKWKRLEDLTSRASKFRLTNLSGEEVREFGRLYRRTAADLAIAREEVRDQRLINYLNHLVGRAHGAIYRTESSGFGVFLSFFRYEFPAVFRKTFRYTLTSFIVFMVPFVLAFAMSFVDDRFSDTIDPGRRQIIEAHHDWTEEVNKANPFFATLIGTNNIQVTFLAFAGGVVAGLGTLAVLAFNGLHIGLVVGLCVRYSHWTIPIFMAAHGVIE
ncbi:MAG TPA: stage II sporulation protein M, partial [Blastocatellia bacterium]|nr:stage II sporulation protein M [Blastocatellia bacterium]